jgi:phospholipid/cholesterol/gamma-HCH transport system substrate-binding protein
MLKYRGSHLIRPGLIGAILIVLVIAVGLQPERLFAWATALRYQALFAEAGGLATGNDVTRSGVKVGTVSNVSLRGNAVLVTFTVDSKVQLGSQSSAHIRTGSLLGQRVMTLESAGGGTLHPLDVIPISRTSSPYSLTESISELTTNAAGTDTDTLNQSLDTLSATIDQIAPQLGPTFEGLTRLSQSINSRNETLRDLLRHATDVTKILSTHSQQVDTLILNADALVGVLAERRRAIVDLLANTSVVAKQLSGLVADNERQLAPTLEKLNSVTAMLEKNRDNIAKALPGLAKFQLTQAETVSNGFYYTAFVPNLVSPQFLQPFMDYAFGFRTFDTAPGRGPGFPSPMPRTLFPWPYNSIPGGSR